VILEMQSNKESKIIEIIKTKNIKRCNSSIIIIIDVSCEEENEESVSNNIL
jgi:hypothetical protein